MVTIADVAERAGVSKTTVSHALSGKRPVAPATRARIAQVIEELDFRPNALARSLRMQRTQMVALIIPDITNPFFPVLARGLQDALIEQAYYLLLCNTDGLPEREAQMIADVIQRKVDGIALPSHHHLTPQFQTLLHNNVSFVFFGSGLHHPLIDTVAIDDQEGAQTAVRYLLQQGHRRIAIFNGNSEQPAALFRLTGYRAALEEAGVPFDPELVFTGEFTRAGGAYAMRYFLAHFDPAERPSAIFCANDLIAIGVLDVAREHNIAVPSDIAIVGYDDIEAASLVVPPLTTIENPAYAIGHCTGQLLLERMQATFKGPGRMVTLPHRLIQRSSA